jgi:hemerythrin-like metal-binding protein
MPPLRWEDGLSLDVPAVDRDHRALIDLLNRLHYLRLAGEERSAIAAAIDALVEYAQEHFSREEMLMRLSGYPEYARHRLLHEAFCRRIARFEARFRADPESVSLQRLSDFVADWITSHILEEDMRIKPYVQKLTEAA